MLGNSAILRIWLMVRLIQELSHHCALPELGVKMNNNPVTLADIHVYETLSNEWHAYVKRSHPAYLLAYSVWASSKKRAIIKLSNVLAEKEIPFDFSN